MAEVLVRYFAAAADAAGREEERLEVETTGGGVTVGALTALLTDRYGAPMARVLRSGSLLVDGHVTRDPGRPVRDRADVLPPFAGG